MERVGPHSYNKYAYPAQLEFLKARIERETITKDQQENTTTNSEGDFKYLIIDRCLFEDRYIFAESQFRSGLINQQEFDSYCQKFESGSSGVEKIDYLIYLRAKTETLMERIRERGREMENGISYEYLDMLQVLYEESLMANSADFSRKVKIYDVDEVGVEDLRELSLKDLVEELEIEKEGEIKITL